MILKIKETKHNVLLSLQTVLFKVYNIFSPEENSYFIDS